MRSRLNNYIENDKVSRDDAGKYDMMAHVHARVHVIKLIYCTILL
jgi:hypothetical protein